MKQVKSKKSLFWEMLWINIIPIFLLAATITSFSVYNFANALNKEVKKGMMDLSTTILTLYNELYPGDYNIVTYEGAIYMLKGEHQINGDFNLIDTIKGNTGVDITFFYQDTRVITTLYDENGERMIGSRVNAVVIKDVLETGEAAFYPSVEIGDEKYFAYYVPILNSDGSCMGMLFVAKPTEEVYKSVLYSILPIVLLGLIAMVLTGIFTMKFTQNLVHDIKKIEDFLSKVAKGNLNDKLDYEVAKRENELGEMGRYAVNMQRALIELVEKDALTGLYNRRYGEKKLNEVYRKKKDQNIDFCLALGDIDYFKKVNDTYGHECGDVVLTEVARTLKKNMRGRGIVSRWGGEEFLLIFENCELAKAKERLEEILAEIAEKGIIYKESTVYLTMTFGVSQGQLVSIDGLLREVDAKLYEGKEGGRNQIV